MSANGANSLRNGPDDHGRFGLYGGRFVAETLMPLILDLEKAYRAAQADPAYQGRAQGPWQALYRSAVAALFRRAADRAPGRRQGLLQARRAQPHRLAQAQQLHRPDPPGQAHGQDPHHRRDRRRPARRRDRHRLRQASGCPASSSWAPPTSSARWPNVLRMKMLGAEVRPVTAGAGTLKDAMNEALRDWVTNVETRPIT